MTGRVTKNVERSLAFLVCIVLSSLVQAAGQARFIPLGALPGSWFTSSAYDISADGSVVVGKTLASGTSNTQAFRWTEAEGLLSLGATPNGYGSTASKISRDGRVAIGDMSVAGSSGHIFRWTQETGMQELGVLVDFGAMAVSGLSRDGGVVVGKGSGAYPNVDQAFRWNATTGLVGLGFLPGGSWKSSIAYAVSADGAVIVGASRSSRAAGFEAFRWTETQGMVGLGLLPGGVSSNASHVSDDGQIVAGNATTGTSATQLQAFRWSAASGMVGLGLLPGAASSVLLDLSADGQVAVGGSGSEAYRWTESTGMVGIGRLPGDTATSATLVSADGRVIVGYSYNGVSSEYFAWTASTGIRTLRAILAADGVDISAWRDLKAFAISDDGSTVVGEGYNPQGNLEGWAIRLPNAAPVANAGGPYSGAKKTAISFDSSKSSDPEGSQLSYRWNFGDGAIGTDPAPTHVYPKGGTYVASLVVNDGVQDSAPATTSVVVTNDVPVARFVGPALAYKKTALTWDGSGSADGNADPLTYRWNFGDGTSTTTSSPTVDHSFSVVGSYTVTLVVNDGEADSMPVAQTVTIQNQPPIANAGPDQTVVQRTTVTLNGTASSDPDGVIANALWKQVSGPKVSISGSGSLTATFVAPRVNTTTTLVFSLTVTDDDGVQASDQVAVKVNRR